MSRRAAADWRRRLRVIFRPHRKLSRMRRFVFFLLALTFSACASTRPAYDTVIRNVAIYDGSGGEARHGDVAIAGDRIAAVGVVDGRGRTEIDGHGLAAAPGFINVIRQAMEDGAFGVASALIYAPGTYATTGELVELCKAAKPYGGMYISHMRSEGDRLLEGVDELIAIARQAGVPAEIYHLKAAGRENWPKMNAVIDRVTAARASGLRITADMYTYTAGATGLDAAMPTWVQAGGYEAWRKRLMDPATRAKVIAEMRDPSPDWESLLRLAGSPDRVLLAGFKDEKLKPLTGKT